jgi:hypothetical protein
MSQDNMSQDIDHLQESLTARWVIASAERTSSKNTTP